jgi:hypothetical protein
MTGGKFRMISAQESGIGGILLFFVITQIVSLGLLIWQMPGVLRAVIGPDAPIAERMWSGYLPLVIAEFVFGIVQGAAIMIGLVLIFRRDPRAPMFYKVLLAAYIVIAVLDLYFCELFSAAVHAYLSQHGKSTTGFDAAIDGERRDKFRYIGYAVIWLLYWRSSERVRLTFAPGSGMTEIPTQS